MAVLVESVDHLVLNVTDPETSAAWYQQVLGMRRKDMGGCVALHFGDQKLHLRPVSVSQQEWFTAAHAVAGSDDLCFVTAASPEETVAHLRGCGVEVELGPVPRIGARGPMVSVYCRDPDGSLIEISNYQMGA